MNSPSVCRNSQRQSPNTSDRVERSCVHIRLQQFGLSSSSLNPAWRQLTLPLTLGRNCAASAASEHDLGALAHAFTTCLHCAVMEFDEALDQREPEAQALCADASRSGGG